MVKKLLCSAVLITALGLAENLVWASGSDAVREASTVEARLYNTGKKVFKEKFACAKCSMANKTLNKALAQKILQSKEITELSEQEIEALQVFLGHVTQ